MTIGDFSAKRGRGIERIAEKQRAKRLMLADKGRQMHKMQGRNQSDIDFRIVERCGFAGNDHVARYRDRRRRAPGRQPLRWSACPFDIGRR